MMAQHVVTRSQRRIEKKQVVLISVLILAVAGVSFALGVMFGRSEGRLPGLTADDEKPKQPATVQVAPPPAPAVPVESVPEQQDKLTFYENLPKGNQAPLGSGINLPPEDKQAATARTQKDVVKPAASRPVKEPKTDVAPAVSADGAFVVQIASFRTREDANKLAKRLENYKMTVFVESANLGDKGVWHRVLAGPYASRAGADQVAGLLREKERLSALVRQR
ncbi:MAG: SPOR domain-containing protein [Desulfuromonadales bacterium]